MRGQGEVGKEGEGARVGSAVVSFTFVWCVVGGEGGWAWGLCGLHPWAARRGRVRAAGGRWRIGGAKVRPPLELQTCAGGWFAAARARAVGARGRSDGVWWVVGRLGNAVSLGDK